jgi:GPH family glycoside/pentoside/hexuronide:cation symporter
MAMPSARLPRFNRLVYASGSIAGNFISRTRDLWLIFFYAPPAGADIDERVPILAIGVVLTVSRVLEALDDPLIGWWSDRTTSRWGRRIPFVVLATPLWVAFFVILWMPPAASETAVNVAYLFAVLMAFHLFSTLSGGPFESLLPEIAPRNEDRVSIVAWQVFFGTVGALIALVGSGILIDVASFQAMAVAAAGLALVSRYVGLAGAWRHARRDVQPADINPWEALKTTLRNDQFLYFLPTFVLFNMAISMMTAMLPFWTSAVLLEGFPTEIATVESGHVAEVQLLGLEFSAGLGVLVSMLAAAAILVVFISLPFVYRLALLRGKSWVYSQAMLMAGLYLPLIAFMGFVPEVNRFSQALVFVALIGVPMSAVFTFPNAIQADIIDYDAVRTGMRREAVYYGAQATLEKIAFAAFPLLLAGLLTLGSSAENPLGIRLVGPVAGLASLIGYLTFRGYRLPDTVTPETLRGAGFEVTPRKLN